MLGKGGKYLLFKIAFLCKIKLNSSERVAVAVAPKSNLSRIDQRQYYCEDFSTSCANYLRRAKNEI